MDFDGYQLRTQDYDDALLTVEKALSLTLNRAQVVYGTQGMTAGFPSDQHTWVRLSWRLPQRVHPEWVGLELASAITDVHKPQLIRSYRWLDTAREVVWRADEMDLIKPAAVDNTGKLEKDPGLDTQWWADLRSSLTALATQPTPHVVMPQEHLVKRINQVFGDWALDLTITEWTTAHGDLHWGNITAPKCFILDWDLWGRAPRGYDAAILWGSSLLVPEIADRIRREFAEDLTSRSGLLAQLLFCSNVIRLARKQSVPGPLAEPAMKEARLLLGLLAL